MRYVELREALKDFTIFSLNDIRSVDSDFFRRRLSEWQEKGYIRKIIKGYYIFSDLELNESSLFEIANRIYSPSYISFEMALSYYHVIPESVYGVTSASSRRTYKFRTPVAEFIYRTVRPQLFFGYRLVRYDNKYFKMATMEKAILDYLYINSNVRTTDDFGSLRVDGEMFREQLNEKRLYGYLQRFAQKRLATRIRTFLEFLSSDRQV